MIPQTIATAGGMATKDTGITTATGFSGVSNDENIKKPPSKVVMNKFK